MIDWQAEQSDKLIGTTIALLTAAAAAGSAGAGIYAAHAQSGAATQGAQITSDAATKAAQIKADSAAQALDFQKQQALLDAQRANATQQANYNQWAAQQGYRSSLGQMLGLPARQIPAYVPLPTGLLSGTSSGTQASGGPSGAASTPSAAAGQMPAGIDPRFAAVYQQAGVTPGARGSGPSDWQYYQQDAVRNAGGDVNYVLGRLAQDLKGGGQAAAPTASQNPYVMPMSNLIPSQTNQSPLLTPALQMPGH
jgi:hypothetical protein